MPGGPPSSPSVAETGQIRIRIRRRQNQLHRRGLPFRLPRAGHVYGTVACVRFTRGQSCQDDPQPDESGRARPKAERQTNTLWRSDPSAAANRHEPNNRPEREVGEVRALLGLTDSLSDNDRWREFEVSSCCELVPLPLRAPMGSRRKETKRSQQGSYRSSVTVPWIERG